MKNYRPLLLQEIGARLPGVHIRRLRLNRHLPEVDYLAEHHHGFSQVLCYLQGGGTMRAGGVDYAITPGALILLPPRCSHAFQETTGRRPLCLVIDLDWRGAVKRGVLLARLNQGEAGAVRQELSLLTRMPEPGAASCRMLVASAALRMIDIFFQRLEILPERRRDLPAFVRRYDRLLKERGEGIPTVASLAARMGYQTDYLNRIFKEATGMTLREYRDAGLLRRAKQLLRSSGTIQEAGEKLGFSDQNYFARWFRKQTGMTPGRFRSE